jgi:hypothetical protein
MKRNTTILRGVFLIALGALFLLQNFGVLRGLDFIWPFLFAAAGAGFLVMFFYNREAWWALIPGFVLLGLAAVTGIELLRLDVPSDWGGALFLGAIGLGFWAVYLVRRDNWWAIIPAGALTTLALIAGLADRASDFVSGGILFIGLALTFGLVFLLARMRWAIYPAAGLAALGIFLLVGLGAVINYLWPIALIAAGLFLVVRVLRRTA